MEIVSVMVPGPPAVSAQTMSKMRTRSRPRISMAIAITGQIAGSTMRRKVSHQAAPSSSAASSQRPVDVGEGRQQDQEHERRPLPDLADEDGGIDGFGLTVQTIGTGRPAIQPMIWLIGP